MSRSIRGSKGPGYDYGSKRSSRYGRGGPNGNIGSWSKRKMNRAERTDEKRKLSHEER